jgi:hypothetical protein
MGRVRKLVSEGRRIHKLRADTARWNQVCSSMDAIDDVELALSSYLEGRPETQSDGENYLVVYGVLQLLYVEQDAAKNLGEPVGIQVKFEGELWEIRNVRNAAVGHPTKNQYRKESNFIVRHSLSRGGFELMRMGADGSLKRESVGLISIVNRQRTAIARILEEARTAMEKEELEHRRQHRNQKLAAAFHDTIHHGFEKIQEWVTDDGHMGNYGLKVVGEAVAGFRQLLSDRGILEVYRDSVLHDIQQTEYVVRRLTDCLNNQAAQFTREDHAVLMTVFDVLLSACCVSLDSPVMTNYPCALSPTQIWLFVGRVHHATGTSDTKQDQFRDFFREYSGLQERRPVGNRFGPSETLRRGTAPVRP